MSEGEGVSLFHAHKYRCIHAQLPLSKRRTGRLGHQGPHALIQPLLSVTGYKVYRGGAVVATSTTTPYADSSLSASTAYSYKVSAIDAAGNVTTLPAATISSSGAGQGTAAAQTGGGGGGCITCSDSFFSILPRMLRSITSIFLPISETCSLETAGCGGAAGGDAGFAEISGQLLRFGGRGIEGVIRAIKFARENKIPYLGLCYGMQLATIEFARNVAKIKGADTEETNPNAKNKIIHSIPFDKKYQVIKGTGTSMRLGAYDCVLKENTLAYNIYAIHNEFKDKKLESIKEAHLDTKRTTFITVGELCKIRWGKKS